VSRLLRLIVFWLAALVLSGGCQEGVPEFPTGVMNLMARYNQHGRHDDAIRVAQNWLSKHPEEHEMRAKFDEQIAMSFFLKVPKDASHKEEWIRQAIAYYDDYLSVYREYHVDIVPQHAGLGLEAAGDLSSSERCLYYGRALKVFAEPYDKSQKTFPMTPNWKEDSLKRVEEKFDRAGCK
jgi:hypothetical protein